MTASVAPETVADETIAHLEQHLNTRERPELRALLLWLQARHPEAFSAYLEAARFASMVGTTVTVTDTGEAAFAPAPAVLPEELADQAAVWPGPSILGNGNALPKKLARRFFGQPAIREAHLALMREPIGDLGMQDRMNAHILLANLVGEAITWRFSDDYDSQRKAFMERRAPKLVGTILHSETKLRPHRVAYSPVVERLRWMLGVGLSDQEASVVVERRAQAAVTFASLAEALMSPKVTAAIDKAQRLIPPLRQALPNMPLRMFSTIRNVWPSAEFLTDAPCWSKAAVHWAEREVPTHCWPKTYTKLKTSLEAHMGFSLEYSRHILSPDILTDLHGHNEKRELQDSAKSLLTYLVTPSLMQEFHQNPSTPPLAYHIESDVRNKAAMNPAGLNLLQSSIFGDKAAGGVAKALLRLHSHSPAMEALRTSIMQPQANWPALGPQMSFKMEGETYDVVPLTSALELRDEGLALQHCVGSYFTDCQNARTHIVSIRKDGQSLATAELKVDLTSENPASTLRCVQFRGRFNSEPSDEAHLVRDRYLAQLRFGAKPLNLEECREQLRRADAGEFYQSMSTQDISKQLELAEQVFPIFRDTLRLGDETLGYQQWLDQTGLREVIRSALAQELEKIRKVETKVQDDLDEDVAPRLG